jgi:hypothetical protein
MCIIIDNNVASLVLINPDPAYQPVYDALFTSRTARVIHGGKLTDEYGPNVKARLRLLDQIGGVRVLAEAAVQAKAAAFAASGLCSSDDPHVLAVAAISGARLLCSDDEPLTADFKNRAILDRPRGKVCHSSKKPGAGATTRATDAAALIQKHCKGTTGKAALPPRRRPPARAF